MRKSNNEKVQTFLDGIQLMDDELGNALIEIRELVFNLHPDAEEKIMYGGIVFFADNEMFSGVFVNQKHTSLEFSKGSVMKDPDSHLEGKGKFRRHLKIKSREDILKKDVAHYVKQAV